MKYRLRTLEASNAARSPFFVGTTCSSKRAPYPKSIFKVRIQRTMLPWCPASFANKVAVAGGEEAEGDGAEEGGTGGAEVEGEVPIGTTAGRRSPPRRPWQ